MSFKKLALAGGAAATLMASTAYASVIDRPFFQVLGVVVVWGGTDFDENGSTAPVVSDFVLLTPASGTAGADLIAGDDVYSVVTGSLDPIKDDGVTGTTDSFDPVTGETSGGTFTDNGTAGVLDAADTLTSFGIDSSTNVDAGLVGAHKSSFYVASNAAFDIFASATLDATSDMPGMGLSNITHTMSLTVPTGAGETDAVTGGGSSITWGSKSRNPGTVVDVASLADMTTPTKVFDGTDRTADSVGTLAEQSVRFDNVYELDTDSSTAGVQGYDLSLGTGKLAADVTYTIYVP